MSITRQQFFHPHSWNSLWVFMEPLPSSKGEVRLPLPIRFLRPRSAHRLVPLVVEQLRASLGRLRVRIFLARSIYVVDHQLPAPPSQSSGTSTGTTPRSSGTVCYFPLLRINHLIADFYCSSKSRTAIPAVAAPVPRLDLGWNSLALARLPFSWAGSWL